MNSMFKVILSEVINGVREIQCAVFSGDNVTLKDVTPWGIDSQPVKDAKGFCDREGRFIFGYQGLAKKSKDGETIVYSTDESGKRVAAIHLTNNGEIIILEGLKLICNIEAEFNGIKNNGDFKSKGGAFTHNGVNVGSTHVHGIKSGSSAPGPTDVPK